MVSIIVPIYNAEKFIYRCLSSVKEQTYTEWEAILVDDGSTDNTAEIIYNIIRGDTRFKYLYKENGGVSSARNKGIECAKGRYVLFLDSDDELTTNCLENIVHWFECYQVDIIQFSFITAKPTDEVQNFCEKENVQKKIYLKDTAIKKMLEKNELKTVVWGGAFKKDVIEELRFDERIYLGEDCCFEFAAVVQSERLLYCSSCMYINRLEPGSITRRQVTQMDVKNVLYTMRYVQNLLVNNCNVQVELNNYLFGEYMGYLNRMVVENSIDQNWDEQEELLREIEQLLKGKKISTPKKYAYTLWKRYPKLYGFFLEKYYAWKHV